MTLYDLTKKYGEGKGEEMMWRTVEIISDAVEKSMPATERERLMRDLYGKMSGGHYNEEYAIEDVSKMYYVDNDGKKHIAPYWTAEQVKEVYDSVRSSIPEEYNFWDFYVVLNMQKADKCMLVKKWYPSASQDEMDQKFVELAITWLDDPDNPYGTSKAWGYLNPAN